MGNWDFVELRKLCKTKGLPDSTLYQNSLNWRWRRANFHAEQANLTWEELFRKTFVLGDQRFQRSAFIYEAHVESCAYALHASVDILAQILNLTLLATPLDIHKVTPHKVLEQLKNDKAVN